MFTNIHTIHTHHFHVYTDTVTVIVTHTIKYIYMHIRTASNHNNAHLSLKIYGFHKYVCRKSTLEENENVSTSNA